MTLKVAKGYLKEAWIPGYGYDFDQTFYVCYKNGDCFNTRDVDMPLPLRGIIGILFFGTDSQFAVGQELFCGEFVDLII